MTVIMKIRQVILRIVAVFAASGLSVIGAGTLAGVELWKAVTMAGVGGVATVVEGLSRAYLKDGDLTAEEIDEVFGSVDKKSRKKNKSEPLPEPATM
jgi:2-keto-4-pentenoate hydratase/2-oxohepta-3-ene-1,7-dioic acid hydratase in catechol pathway